MKQIIIGGIYCPKPVKWDRKLKTNTKNYTALERMKKITEEAGEAMEAELQGDLEHAALEYAHVIIAAVSALDQIGKYDLLPDLINMSNEQNRQRGALEEH